ncbi:hypothetical protein PT974_03476 [Cladobotryum mycophilum]|uniref:Uncharacterized protein n=1 Tax=Cladobotryum mycophilum TaxID=491253 RepID=A0ABR0SSF3_9HYPO
MKFTAAIVALATVAVATPTSPPLACKAGTYSCLPYGNGWQTCNTSGQWVFSGDCPPKTVCKFYNPSQSPYCVPPPTSSKKKSFFLGIFTMIDRS